MIGKYSDVLSSNRGWNVLFQDASDINPSVLIRELWMDRRLLLILLTKFHLFTDTGAP